MDAVSENAATSPALRLYPEPSEADRTRMLRLLLLGALVSLSLVPVATLADISLAAWIATDPLPGDLAKSIELTEAYSHGVGVLMLLVGVMILVPNKRGFVPRLATMALGGGAIATIVKMFVLRPRPSQLNLELASYDAAWQWVFDWRWEQIAAFDASTRSFPSGNTATAVGLTVALCMLFPRGRYLFPIFAVMTLTQRLQCQSHFLSDVFGGTACSLLWCYACLHPRLLGALFERMEPETRGYAMLPRQPVRRAA